MSTDQFIALCLLHRDEVEPLLDDLAREAHISDFWRRIEESRDAALQRLFSRPVANK